MPGPGQVRIAVGGGGRAPPGHRPARGQARSLPAPALPTIPGREVAGVVDMLGGGVAAAGSAGAWSPISARPRRLRRTRRHRRRPGSTRSPPTSTSRSRRHDRHGRTTMGILQFADLGPDSVAVIPAAAGGIGTLLVQYAKNAGATVIGLAGGPGRSARVGRTAPTSPSTTRTRLARQGPRPPRRPPRHRRLRRRGRRTGRAAVDLLGKGGRLVRLVRRRTPQRAPLTSPTRNSPNAASSQGVLGPA